jgi:DNA-binding transcriptional regulator YiaG
MRPDRVRYLRRLLKMSEAEMATALRMPGAEGESLVRRWEDGKRLPSGSASLALMYLSQGRL